MTINQDDIIKDQSERDSLLKTISDIETAVAGSTPGPWSLLQIFLENAKGRVSVLETKINDEILEREQHARTEIALASLAQKEAALSEEEKETYSGFLAKEFFTKRDFKSLDQFYADTWDRLSDDGKEEMSHRVWEGIRHDEYRFTDLPRSVQEKEAKRVYNKLTGASVNQSSLTQIPENDRTDFIVAYNAGDHREAAKVLSRESFRQNVALESSATIRHKTADLDGKAAYDKGVVDGSKGSELSAAKQTISAVSPGSMADLPTDSLNMNGVKLMDAASPSVAAIPDASRPRLNVR